MKTPLLVLLLVLALWLPALAQTVNPRLPAPQRREIRRHLHRRDVVRNQYRQGHRYRYWKRTGTFWRRTWTP